MRVSNVATMTGEAGLDSPSIHSRMPRSGIVVAPCCRAESRVDAFDIENACVGPPTTTRSTWAGISSAAVAASTSWTSSTPDCVRIPSAIDLAIAPVFPQIVSYTTSARMNSSFFVRSVCGRHATPGGSGRPGPSTAGTLET